MLYGDTLKEEKWNLKRALRAQHFEKRCDRLCKRLEVFKRKLQAKNQQRREELQAMIQELKERG